MSGMNKVVNFTIENIYQYHNGRSLSSARGMELYNLHSSVSLALLSDRPLLLRTGIDPATCCVAAGCLVHNRAVVQSCSRRINLNKWFFGYKYI
ncbi:hypothetical protein SFRURICE_020078, partial [Spodoptera frugiperda]